MRLYGIAATWVLWYQDWPTMKNIRTPSITYQRFQPAGARRLCNRFVGDTSPFGPSGGTASRGELLPGEVGPAVLESREELTSIWKSRGTRAARANKHGGTGETGER